MKQSGKVAESGRVGRAPSGASLRSSPGHPSDDVRRLVALTQHCPAIGEILHTIHFADLTTPYPPVSQTVFAFAALTTPDAAPTHTHLVVMKAWIVLFDLLTMLAVIGTLRPTRPRTTRVRAHPWCPPALEELADSGRRGATAAASTRRRQAPRRPSRARTRSGRRCVRCPRTGAAWSGPRRTCRRCPRSSGRTRGLRRHTHLRSPWSRRTRSRNSWGWPHRPPPP